MNELRKFGKYIILGLVGLAFIMLLIPGAVESSAFGMTVISDYSAIQHMLGLGDAGDFSFLGFLTLVLIIGGVALPFIEPLEPKLRYLIGAGVLLLAVILLFIFPGTLGGSAEDDFFEITIKVSASVPIIISGILLIGAAGFNGFLAYTELTDK